MTMLPCPFCCKSDRLSQFVSFVGAAASGCPDISVSGSCGCERCGVEMHVEAATEEDLVVIGTTRWNCRAEFE